jgi:hypothetical protein
MQLNQLSQSSLHGRVLLIACILLSLIGHDTSVANDESALTIPSTELHTERGRETPRDTPDIIEQASEDSWNVDLVGRWIGGACEAIAAKDSIAYAGVLGGLIVIDFSSPGAPVELARLTLPTGTEGITIHGDHAYVASGNRGLEVVDISDPTSPVAVGSYDTGDRARNVAVSGDHAYVANWESGLCVVDISDPADLREVGSFDTGFKTWDVAVSGDYAYVVGGGLRVINVSNPANPFEEGFDDTGSSPRSLAVSGSYAYASGFGSGFRVFNISNPADPFEEGFNDSPLWGDDVAVSGNYAYVADFARVRVFDVSDPTAPLQVARRGGIGNLYVGVALSGDLLYLANDARGVVVRDNSDPRDPDVVGTHATGDRALDVTVSSNYAYVANREDGLRVIDISDPMLPQAVGHYDTTGSWRAGAVAVSGDYAYVSCGCGLVVLDISDPTDPREVAVYDPPSTVIEVALRGDYAYVATESDGLRVVNISTPDTPIEEGVYLTGGMHVSVAVSGAYAYVGERFSDPDYSGRLSVIDISDPQAPFGVGSLDLEAMARDVAVSGDYAYVTSGRFFASSPEGGLRVINISNPRAPFEVGSYVVRGTEWPAGGVAVVGTHVYVAYYEHGLRVIDVSDPASPQEVAFYDTGHWATSLTVRGDDVYVSDDANGLYILEHVEQRLTAHLDIKPGACPNPLNINVPNGENANGGVLPVAILGTDGFDVRDIDVSSLELAGAAPLRHSYKDVAGPPGGDNDCVCSEVGADGYPDLTLKFRRLDVVAGLGGASGDNVPVTLTGLMKDGTPIEGVDCVRIVPRKGGEGPQLASTSTPAVTALGPATPNPFNPTTTIAYELANGGHVTIKVYDVTGKLVTTLVDGDMPGGQHQVTWEAKSVSSGVFFYRMTAPGFVQTRKMVLLK